jgi:phage tail-like protein
MGELVDPLTSFNFEVLLRVGNAAALGLANPLCDAGFAECDGLEMTMEPKTWREGGNNQSQIHRVGPVSYGNLTLKRGMSNNLDLWKWFALSTGNDSRSLRASGVILVCDAAHRPTLRYTLYDCLPLKIKAPALNARDGIVAVEELQLVYRRFTLEAV